MAVNQPDANQEIGHFELFGAGQGEKQLPVNEVVEEYTFGQFVKLRYPSETGGSRPVVLGKPSALNRQFIEIPGFGPPAEAVSIKGILSGKPEPMLSEKLLRRVPIEDLDALI